MRMASTFLSRSDPILTYCRNLVYWYSQVLYCLSTFSGQEKEGMISGDSFAKMTEEENKNTLGAIIFFTYIIAALVLTCVLLNDLNLPSASSTRPRRHASQSTKRRQHGATNQESTRPWLFAALSATSFAALSYHMLNFLLESYRVWSTTKLMDFKVRPRHIWTWSTESRLFREFGEVICNDPRRFWWTRSALVYSFGWNLYMSIEGTSQ